MMVRAAQALGISAAALLPDDDAAAEARSIATAPTITPKLRRALDLCPGLARLGELSRAGLKSVEIYVGFAAAEDARRNAEPAIPTVN
jgi:hypothetical protein